MRRIEPSAQPKIWGSKQLEPWFRNAPEKIGEFWFPAGNLLIKFLFTTDNLSVQVHPGDAYAGLHENARGKTEMWYILRSEPDAKIALGFREQITPEHVRKASQTDEIVDALRWIPVHAGEAFLVPAGTAHAIGAGIALVEIQQNSDVTYRLYDYGRPRELHLDKAMDVIDCGLHPGMSIPGRLSPNRTRLAQCQYFVTDLLEFSDSQTLNEPDSFLVVLEGSGTFSGDGFGPGQVWETGSGPLDAQPRQPVRLLITRG